MYIIDNVGIQDKETPYHIWDDSQYVNGMVKVVAKFADPSRGVVAYLGIFDPEQLDPALDEYWERYEEIYERITQ